MSLSVGSLLTAKTYEMHMFHSASLKLGLERAVLSQNRNQGDDSDDNGKPTRRSESEAKAKEIDELLKKGAYDIFRDDDDNEAEKFMETDIDQLLEHSSKLVTYGLSSTQTIGSGLGSFSKASFVATTDSGEKDVDLDDPDFWSKAIGLEVPPEEPPEEIAAMLDDGVKRNRKQVQVYDPYADQKMADQLKKDKLALERMLEKEEKERLAMEKKMKKQRSKEDKKRKQTDEQVKKNPIPKDQKLPPPRIASDAVTEPNKSIIKVPKISKELRPKKTKKSERMRALRRAENENPAIEKLKQAWDVPQRNRATAAAIRFGFGRFCKLRHESSLTSLPLQDLENFIRSYVYQLAIQVCVTLLTRLQGGLDMKDIPLILRDWLWLPSSRELQWLCESLCDAMKFQLDVDLGRKFLRIPLILTEQVYVNDLKSGVGFRALRRICLLSRLNSFFEECIDSILCTLGSDEVGRRGCEFTQLSSLDIDLKARFVTSEELMLVVSDRLRDLKTKYPAAWWDRSCDVGLIVGTFVHGLGNYDSMRRDHTLPFSEKINKFTQHDLSSKNAAQCFRMAASAARKCFDDALEANRIKAELEVQAAVAAAAKAAAQREEVAALVRKGGSEAEVAAKQLPETQVEDAFEYDGTDSHFVTLPRMQEYIKDAAFKHSNLLFDVTESQAPEETQDASKQDDGIDDSTVAIGRAKKHYLLSMPDSRVLDHRLLCLIKAIETPSEASERGETNQVLWEKSEEVAANLMMRSKVFSVFMRESALDIVSEYAGIGLGGNQCGTSHRTLNDGSDYSFGSASNQLALVTYGTDAPRFLRALGVPLNVSRFAISALLYADSSCVDELLKMERLRYYGEKLDKQDVVTLDSSSDNSKGPRSLLELSKTEGSMVVESKNESVKKASNNYSHSVVSKVLSEALATSQTNQQSTDHQAMDRIDHHTDVFQQEKSKDDQIMKSENNRVSNNKQLSSADDANGKLQRMNSEISPDSTIQPKNKPVRNESSAPSTESKTETENVASLTRNPTPSPFNDPGSEQVSSKNEEQGKLSRINSLDVSSKPNGKGLDPVGLIPDIFRKNAHLRASICLAAVFLGFPGEIPDSSVVNVDLWKSFLHHEPTGEIALFRIHKFRDAVLSLAPDVDVLDVESLRCYVESTLLPHCLRLCVNGNGPSTRNARGSHGDYETAFGISTHPEPSRPYPSPLPDPCLDLRDHSLEAVGLANAILRRHRLLRACVYVCSRSSEIPVNVLEKITRSDRMGQLEGMPCWWCPWKHDVALLFQAATQGLFSILHERSDHFLFAPAAVREFLASLDSTNHFHFETSRFPESALEKWIQYQSSCFPSLNQLERRLGSLCALLTASSDHAVRFDLIPMFDHGAWPRN
jgi:hypothetical protein